MCQPCPPQRFGAYRIERIGPAVLTKQRTDRELQIEYVVCPSFASEARWEVRVNAFDAAVTVMLIMAARAGFKTGLLRSTATALGYLTAMPVAVAITPLVSPAFAGNSSNPVADSSVLLLGVFLVTGMALGAVFRSAVAETIGPDISMADRLAGSMVGSLRTL